MNGYTAESTLVLVALFREHWAVVGGKTLLTLEDLARIEKNAQAMLSRLDERELGANRMPTIELRRRALSRLYKHYGEVRRMVGYVRYWEQDADQIAPSLFSGRGRRARGEEPESPESPVPAVTPVSPGAGANVGGSPFTS